MKEIAPSKDNAGIVEIVFNDTIRDSSDRHSAEEILKNILRVKDEHVYGRWTFNKRGQRTGRFFSLTEVRPHEPGRDKPYALHLKFA